MSNFREITVKFPLPANCKPGEEEYYSMSIEGTARACSVIHLKDIWANRELVLWKDGEMLPEAFAWDWLREKLYGSFKERAKFKIKNILRPYRKVEEPVLWCLDGYSTGGYFHFITDILPRLWMAREYLPEIHFAVPDYFITKWPFVTDFFQLLEINNLLIIENKYKYLLQNLVLPTRAGNPFYLQPVPLKEGVRWLRDAALEQSTCFAGERVYISRSKANYRKVLNEEVLYPVLQKFGFTVLNFEDYTLADQVSICHKAKVILGLHGAGLTNLAFLPPGGKVIEIRPKNVYHMYTCFFTLAPYFDCEYNYVLCNYAPIQLPNDKRIDDHSVLLSPQELENSLKEILK